MAEATESQIALWRGAIALAAVDGKLDEAEKAHLDNYIDDNIYLSLEQKLLLKRDMLAPAKIEDVWPQITDMQDRAHLIDIAPELIDENRNPAEKAAFDKIYAEHMKAFDTQKDMADMAAFAQALRVKSDAEVAEYGKPLSRVSRLVNRIERALGMDPTPY